MKQYSVSVSEPAMQDVLRIYQWTCDQKMWEIEQINTWYNGMWQAIYSLNNMPGRYPVVAESERLRIPIRQKLYHNFRILFTIRQETVYVLSIRHTAQNLW